MQSCKPKNRTARANKNEYRGRVLRGSDRSAHSRPSPNCCFGQVIRKPQNNYGRSSQAPPASARTCSIYNSRSVNPVVASNIEIVRGRCQKITHSRFGLGSSKFFRRGQLPSSGFELSLRVASRQRSRDFTRDTLTALCLERTMLELQVTQRVTRKPCTG